METFKLWARLQNKDTTLFSLVLESADYSQLLEKQKVEEVCWSDEGISYFIIPKNIAKNPRQVHVPYDKLCERVMK